MLSSNHTCKRWDARRLDFDLGPDQSRDILDRLMDTDKMVVIGKLAAVVDHDNSSCVRHTRYHMLLAEEALGRGDIEEARKHFQNVTMGVESLSTAYSNSLEYAGRRVTVQKPVHLQSMIRKTVDFLRPSFSNLIDLEIRDYPQALHVWGNIQQLQQVVINLAWNARQAIGGNEGKITITTHLLQRESDRKMVLNSLSEGTHVAFSVGDNGCGMDEATFEKIAEPFFTTKVKGEGNGLGLLSAKCIVHLHKGTIAVSTKEGKGSVFTVYLPLYRP